MATEALQRQIQGKWQNAFARLNRDQQGITGLLGFSEVRAGYILNAISTYVWIKAWTLATDFLHPRDLNDPEANKEWGVFAAVYGSSPTQPRLP